MGSFGRLLIGMAVSFGCLYVATRGTDWSQVAGVVAGANPVWVAALFGIILLSHVVRAQRWRVLLRPIGQVPLSAAFSATLIGFAASSVLPLRLGEILRPALLGRRMGCGLGPAIASVVVERLFDMLFVIGMLVGLSFVLELPPRIHQGAVVLGVVATTGMTTLVLMQWYRTTADHLIDAAVGLLPEGLAGRLRPIIAGLMNGMSALGDGRAVAQVALYSLLLWLVVTASWGAGILALRIPVPLLAGSLTSVVMVAAFVFLPQGPGFVGTWQLACKLALGHFGVSEDVAIGYSLLTWAAQMVLHVVVGGFCLAREDVSLRDLMQQTRKPEAPSVV